MTKYIFGPRFWTSNLRTTCILQTFDEYTQAENQTNQHTHTHTHTHKSVVETWISQFTHPILTAT
jgi:hypothetical protein